ncbi:MAG: 1-deoxy-D-xylulose-5-phosphate synthase [Endomicrobiaceae bacterium]|nr:1-deoxy-D-xylulose-5-phosphate synthase [Endomicrobiaceae bacterium]
MSILENISSPNAIKIIDKSLLPDLAQEVRQEIIETTSKTGGHIASSLGVVDLTIALHYVFDVAKDKFIWDVGHQAYAHKILTGRKDNFNTLRQYKGISGFPKIAESKYDSFGAGHASTSISAGLGFAVARDIQKEDYKVVSIIGDGSMTGGLAFEGLQNAGTLAKDMLVILNDNQMFISQKVGVLAGYFANLLTAAGVKKIEESVLKIASKLKFLSFNSIKKLVKRFKTFLFPGLMFEEMGFTYVGPIDGHNINQLIEILTKVKDFKGPVLLHVVTKKGKGYKPAEKEPTKFHGIGPFDIETGKTLSLKKVTYTEVFSKAIVKLAKEDEKIVAITAAMPDGTGLKDFSKKYPERFFDVGIDEAHAVTFAAALAAGGLKPVVAIYSTFMQRALDSIIHDVALQNLPVIMMLDRAGIVGEDGATHHGAFDLSYLKYIPNLTIMAPANETELQDMFNTALTLKNPSVIRYPRGSGTRIASFHRDFEILETGKAKLEKEGKDACIICLGNVMQVCLDAANELETKGISVSVLNMRFLKPFDEQAVKDILKYTSKIVTVEEGSLIGGMGETVKSILSGTDAKIFSIGLPDKFVEHGKQKLIREICGFSVENIENQILNLLNG